MISVSGKTWTQHKVNKNLIEKVKQDYGFSDIFIVTYNGSITTTA